VDCGAAVLDDVARVLRRRRGQLAAVVTHHYLHQQHDTLHGGWGHHLNQGMQIAA